MNDKSIIGKGWRFRGDEEIDVNIHDTTSQEQYLSKLKECEEDIITLMNWKPCKYWIPFIPNFTICGSSFLNRDISKLSIQLLSLHEDELTKWSGNFINWMILYFPPFYKIDNKKRKNKIRYLLRLGILRVDLPGIYDYSNEKIIDITVKEKDNLENLLNKSCKTILI